MVYSLAFYGVLIIGIAATLIFVALHLHYRIVDIHKAIKRLRADLSQLHKTVHSMPRQPTYPRFKPRIIEGSMTVRKDGHEATAEVSIKPTKIIG